MPAWKWLEIWLDFMLPAGLLFIGLLLTYTTLKAYRFRPRPLCLHCGYDMRASQSLTCPECGKTTPTTQVLNHGNLSKRRLGLAITLMLPGIWVIGALTCTWISLWPQTPAQSVSSPKSVNHSDVYVKYETASHEVALPPPTSIFQFSLAHKPLTLPDPLPVKLFFWINKAWDLATYTPIPDENSPGTNKQTLFYGVYGPASDQVLLNRAKHDAWFGFTLAPQLNPDHYCCTSGPYRPTGYTTVGYFLSAFLNPIGHYQRYFITNEEKLKRVVSYAQKVKAAAEPPPDSVNIIGQVKKAVGYATLPSSLFKEIANNPYITEITLADLALTDSNIDQLIKLESVKTLKLNRVIFSNAQLRRLATHEKINHLSIEQADGQPNLDFTALESWKNLATLSIDPGTREFWDLPDKDFARMLSLPNLTRLYLRTSKVRMNQITLSLAAAKKRKITVGKQSTFVFTQAVNPDNATELARLTGMTIRVEPDERAE